MRPVLLPSCRCVVSSCFSDPPGPHDVQHKGDCDGERDEADNDRTPDRTVRLRKYRVGSPLLSENKGVCDHLVVLLRRRMDVPLLLRISAIGVSAKRHFGASRSRQPFAVQ